MNKIASFEAACALKGIDPNRLPDLEMIAEEYRKPIIAQYKLMIIRDAIVGDWKADWSNYRQYKYLPWFALDKPGFRFYDVYYGLAFTRSTGGSRLCFQMEEQAQYCATQFLDLYCDLMGGELQKAA